MITGFFFICLLLLVLNIPGILSFLTQRFLLLKILETRTAVFLWTFGIFFSTLYLIKELNGSNYSITQAEDILRLFVLSFGVVGNIPLGLFVAHRFALIALGNSNVGFRLPEIEISNKELSKRIEKTKIAVIVPAFNEEMFVGRVLANIPSFIDKIIVVDDCSFDNTHSIALNTKDDRVVVVRNPENLGVGGSIIKGHIQAFKSGCQISVVMAGDNQMDPAYLTDLLKPVVLGFADYSKGNRFTKREHLSGMPPIRIIGSVLLAILMKLSTGYYRLGDPQNGYTAISRKIFEQMNLSNLQSRYTFENSMLSELHEVGGRVCDVPVNIRYANEPSGLKIRRFIPEMLRFYVSHIARKAWWFKPKLQYQKDHQGPQ